ncbi:MAG: hypothetical protein QXQ37_04860 [Nitrososphaerota archaeon]
MACKPKSKAQVRLLFAKERRGELPKGTAHRLAKKVDVSRLPERKKKKKSSLFSVDALRYFDFNGISEVYQFLKKAAAAVTLYNANVLMNQLPLEQIPNHKVGLIDLKDLLYQIKKDLSR